MTPLSILKTFIGKKFYDVYSEVSRDGIGGHIIRCFDCGIVLDCREPDEIIKRSIDLLCNDCMRPGIFYGKIMPKIKKESTGKTAI
jgi:hypothetical protein